jgi:gluconolactonase
MDAGGKVESLVDNYKGGRFNRPNDVICHSNGCLYFTDPAKRRAYHERAILRQADTVLGVVADSHRQAIRF